MKKFNSLEEMMPYYDKVKNLFYVEDDIKLNFDLTCDWDIYAYNIKTYNNIKARDIKTYNNIKARNIDAWNINAMNINAKNIDALNINTDNIYALNIDAWNINAMNINAKDIIADDINANNIEANEISYRAVCFAYKNIICNRIKGRRENSKHFVLDGELIVKGDEEQE